ncbi:crossover junction endonuclease EME1-like isoform X2 [Mya arenaria]|uniref:crossover junction endonuclease EME1-like isoform X2 n=1 Tax=Mya arenaria TaxID=6604 RepID=UPI0022E59550|nr:crossover junction endonuclease EME1-like isoform X2 [Mya arenaria]
MNKKSCRNDFISDGSSDEEDNHVVGSLWDRLARKRNIGDISDTSSGFGATVPSLASTKSGSPNEDVESSHSSVSTFSTSTAPVASTAGDVSSEDEMERLLLSQILQEKGEGNSVSLGNEGGRGKKKRSREEIEENRKIAQEKKAERAKQKQMKEVEKEMRKAEREAKKTYSLNSCLQFIKVLVDTNVVNTCGLGVLILKACEELGVTCETRELPLPFTVMWVRNVASSGLGQDMKVETVYSEVEEQEVISVVPVADFVQMVDTFKQRQRGLSDSGITLQEYVSHMKSSLAGKNISVVVLGVEQYFRVDMEETTADTLMHADCMTFMHDSPEEVADMVRRFSKAVAERPAKKDRFDPIFSFHEEGVGGVKVDRSGGGLLKVWKHQLLQFKNVSPDIAQAIIAVFPSPQMLRQAYKKCQTEKEAIQVLENIVVRRGAGVLETSRRVGKELSRRIYMLFTCDDPDFVIR